MYAVTVVKNNVSRILLCQLLCLIVHSVQANELHSWNDPERLMMKHLWIGSLEPHQDKSNRVVNNPHAIQLGHRLFFDKRLSANGKVACASCHQPQKYFSDGLATGKALQLVTRNTPTIVGVSQHHWFFLDGRNDSLWSQALGPIENELEHGSNRAHVVHVVYHDKHLRKLYEKLFGELPELTNTKRFPKQAGPVNDKQALQNWQSMTRNDQQTITDIYVNIGKAIAAYESQLQPAPSRFDQYAEGVISNKPASLNALKPDEVKGLRIFISQAKCVTCHSGPMFSDLGFHNISVQPPKGKQHDIGRYEGARNVLKNPFNCRSRYNDDKKSNCEELEYMVMDGHETQGAFKTPSLRNVAKTAPYMHAGQYTTLREVLKHYNDPPPVVFRRSELFLQVDLSEAEFGYLEAFLRSLDSDIAAPARLLVAPE